MCESDSAGIGIERTEMSENPYKSPELDSHIEQFASDERSNKPKSSEQKTTRSEYKPSRVVLAIVVAYLLASLAALLQPAATSDTSSGNIGGGWFVLIVVYVAGVIYFGYHLFRRR